MLMKKIQCQFQLSVIHPPITGPSAGPDDNAEREDALRLPCSLMPYVSRRIACEVAIRPPPPRP